MSEASKFNGIIHLAGQARRPRGAVPARVP